MTVFRAADIMKICKNCGEGMADECKFCPSCGAVQNMRGEENTGDAVSGLGEELEKQADDIGKGFEEAARDVMGGMENMGQSFEDAGRELYQEFRQAGDSAKQRMNDVHDGIKNNWRDYITPENMELLVAAGLFLPLFMGLVNMMIGGFFGPLGRIPGAGMVFRLVPHLIRAVFIILSGVSAACAVYLLVQNSAKQTVWGIVTAVAECLAFLACLGIAFSWPVIPVLFGMFCLVLGLDVASRVVLQKKGMESQPNPGEDIAACQGAWQEYKRTHPSGNEEEERRIAADPKASYFDGDGLTLLGYILLTVVVSGITCGIAAPWMICMLNKWRLEHTVIGGRRLAFNGTGGSLLGHWILWEILSVITCGIYSFFMYVALKKWELGHTYYADEPQSGTGASGSFFDGNSFEYFGYGLLQSILLLITCGLAAPWTLTMIQKWEIRHEVISGDRLYYNGTGLGILGQYIIVYLLSLITFGIYSPWGLVRINRYICSHTHVDA